MHCTKCGSQLSDGTKFCGSCGTPVGGLAVGGGEGESPEKASGEGMGLMTAVGLYLACMGIFGALLSTAPHFAFFFYFGAGIFMSRGVMRRLIQWHPVYDTLYNVTSAKLTMVAMWPLSMLSLLFRLTVNKVL